MNLLKNNVQVTEQDIRSSVLSWNFNFPVDKWWRMKHSISFGSKDHLDASFVDMYFEYVEDLIISEYIKDPSKNNSKDKYVPGSGDIFRSQLTVMSQKEIDDAYNNLDINSFNKEEINKKL